MGYLISYVCVSHTGLFRQANQDNFLCGGTYLPAEHQGTQKPLRGSEKTEKGAVFGIFDGIGGGEKGEMASYLAAKTAAEIKIGIRPLISLRAICRRANDAIRDYGNHLDIGSMGTTATVLSFTGSHVHLCHLGDSRAYRFRDGILTRLTKDHVLSGSHGRKPPLTRYLGMSPEEDGPDPLLTSLPLATGDIYLICSDGLTDMLSEDEIRRILCTVPFDSMADHLLNTALCRGGRDNVTLILCKTKKCSRYPMLIHRLFSRNAI